MSEWIKCEDRLPPIDIPVLVARFDNRTKVRMYFIEILVRFSSCWVDTQDNKPINPKYGYVTHWMPLPEPPKEDLNG